MLINEVSFLSVIQSGLLNLLFELVVFGLLAAFVTSLFKEYALPVLYQEIEDIKTREKNIKNKKNLLKEIKVKLEKELEDQTKEFSYLEKKVNFWNASYVQNEKKKAEEDALLVQKNKNKVIKQTENLALFKMQKIVIPRAEKEAYLEIEKNYKGKKGEELLKELISTIRPKTN